MEDIYFNCTLLKRVVVPSKHLNANIDSYIYEYIKKNVEGICIHEGYIKPETVSILKKSIGILIGSSFTGDITYDVAYTAQVCNPVIGNIINCKVKFVNKMGILASNGPITVIIGRQFHLNDELAKIERDNDIKVEVVARTFSLNDKEIKIVAKLHGYGNGILSTLSNKSTKVSEYTESDMTPIVEDDFDDNLMENTEDLTEDILDESDEETEIQSIDDEELDEFDDLEELEDVEDIEEDDEKPYIKLENPDEENMKIDDIEISDDEDDYDEDVEVEDEY